jgi:hypothetical protein
MKNGRLVRLRTGLGAEHEGDDRRLLVWARASLHKVPGYLGGRWRHQDRVKHRRTRGFANARHGCTVALITSSRVKPAAANSCHVDGGSSSSQLVPMLARCASSVARRFVVSTGSPASLAVAFVRPAEPTPRPREVGASDRAACRRPTAATSRCNAAFSYLPLCLIFWQNQTRKSRNSSRR